MKITVQNTSIFFRISRNHSILLAGDARQTLPVIPRSTLADELDACLKSSVLWKHVKKFKLTVNMRVELQNDQLGDFFSKQLLDIGNYKIVVDILNSYIQFALGFC